jgi:hypothetical protein
MKRFITHLVIALATFMVGVSATTLFPAFNHTPESKLSERAAVRFVEEAEITGTVFRQQMEPEANPELKTYYLSCHNYSDPPEEVMTYLVKNGLPVKALSQAQNYSYRPNAAGRVFIRVGSVKWVSDTEVVVGGSVRDDTAWSNHDTRTYIYRLVRGDKGWKVISTETIS